MIVSKKTSLHKTGSKSNLRGKIPIWYKIDRKQQYYGVNFVQIFKFITLKYNNYGLKNIKIKLLILY